MTSKRDVEDTTVGGITWHSSEPDGGPDVWISVCLGGDQRLWIGEITNQLFEQSGKDHFDSDGGWFLVWYKPEPVLIAKCGDTLDAREFAEHIASMIRLSAQQREPAVRVKELVWEADEKRGGIKADRYWVAAGAWTPGYFLAFDDSVKQTGFEDEASAKSAAQADYEQRIMAAIEIIPAGAGASSDGGRIGRR